MNRVAHYREFLDTERATITINLTYSGVVNLDHVSFAPPLVLHDFEYKELAYYYEDLFNAET